VPRDSQQAQMMSCELRESSFAQAKHPWTSRFSAKKPGPLLKPGQLGFGGPERRGSSLGPDARLLVFFSFLFLF
jgi:hypothetical protein